MLELLYDPVVENLPLKGTWLLSLAECLVHDTHIASSFPFLRFPLLFLLHLHPLFDICQAAIIFSVQNGLHQGFCP